MLVSARSWLEDGNAHDAVEVLVEVELLGVGRSGKFS